LLGKEAALWTPPLPMPSDRGRIVATDRV